MKAPAAVSLAHFGIRFRPIRLAELSMLAFLAVAMGLPLSFLLIGSFNLAPPGKDVVYGLDNWVRAFSDPGTLSALWMSFLLSTVRLLPAIIFSVVFAWLIARTDMPGGKAVANGSDIGTREGARFTACHRRGERLRYSQNPGHWKPRHNVNASGAAPRPA